MSTNALADHALELLSSLGRPTARRMFGGHGLYVEGVFVALVAFDRLYLKADDLTRQTFAAAGGERFTYGGRGRLVQLDYWTVPPQAMDSAEQMRPWARLALEAALRAAASRRARKPSSPRARSPDQTARRSSAAAAKAAKTRGRG